MPGVWMRRKKRLRAGAPIVLPDGSRVTLARNWEQMTMEDLASIGVTPEMSGNSSAIAQFGDSGGGAVTDTPPPNA